MRRSVKKFSYKGCPITIHREHGIYTANLNGLNWSLNTFRPESLSDAVAGAKHIIDHPPRCPEGGRAV
jgi:hypothetical protein